MSKFRFTAEMFEKYDELKGSYALYAAELANAALDAELAKCERVYGIIIDEWNDETWKKNKDGHSVTHTALLWDVGPIEKISGLFEPNCEPSEGEK